MKPKRQPDCENCPSRKDSLFTGLPGDELVHLSTSKTCNTYQKGQVIFYEGNFPMGLYCINKGKIKVYKMGRMGKEQIVRLAKPGDLIGYRAFIGEDVYTATAEALEESVICFIDKKSFQHVIDSAPDIPAKLMRNLCAELRDAENFIQSMAQKSVRERLAEVILILEKKYGPDASDPTLLDVALSREDIANITGTAIETAIRLLSDMKESGLIAFEGRKIRILDHAKLVDAASLDY
jgi:CRP/FNR family transcriptional regulator